MKYTKITHKKAIQIINGASEDSRKLYVMDVSCMGTGVVYESDDGSIFANTPGQEEPDLIMTGSAAKNRSWYVGEDEDGCILEARVRGKVDWSGEILVNLHSMEDILANFENHKPEK